MSEENTAPEASQEVGLSYQDIIAAVQIIDVTSQRGAIQGDEMLQVGTVRERLVAFLRYAKENGEDIDLPPSSMNTPNTPAEEAPAEEAE
jgi:hypothetical protein